jgi:sugar-specific transcriptional regulator TrmB
MYNKIISSLKLLGFDDVDCEVYRTVLVSKITNQLQIHKQTGIDRRKIQKSVSFLDSKGLIDTTTKSQIKIKDPAKIVSLMEFREYELKKERVHALDEINRLKYDFDNTRKKIVYYDSKADYVVLFNSMLDSSSEIYHIGDEKSFIDVIGREYFETWLQKRVSRGIKAFDLTFSLGDLADLNISNLPNTTFALLPYLNKFPGSIIFWNNKVAIFSSDILKVIVIEDAEIFQIFIQLWKVIFQLTNNHT